MADDEVVPGAGHRAENSRFVGGDMRSRIGHLQATRFASESEGVSEEREGIAGPKQGAPPIAGGNPALGGGRKEEGCGWSFGTRRQVGGIAGGSDRDDVRSSGKGGYEDQEKEKSDDQGDSRRWGWVLFD